ncbi:MAG: hypothetical protein KF712_06005 [Akkermansiaceae bacterium]|nr:hypothetical protein [Akkermansiaceae bacterium]
MKAAAFLLLSVCLAAGDVAEVRLLSCSPEIANAMRANLNGGKLTDEAFEKAYDRLTAGKQIEELDRFRKDDWEISSEQPREFVFTSPGWDTYNAPQNGIRASNKGWEHQIRIIASLHKSRVEYGWSKFSLPPGSRDFGLNRFELEAMTITTLPSPTWQIMDETSYGNQVVISLFRHSAATTPAPDPATRLYWAEGLFLIAGPQERDAITGMDQERLRLKVTELRKSAQSSDFFRIRAGSSAHDPTSGPFFRHRKGAWEDPANDYQADKVTATNMTLFSGDLKFPGDAGETELTCVAELAPIPGPGLPLEKYEFRFTGKLPLGTWIAVTSNTPDKAGRTGIFFTRISLPNAD